MTCSSAGVMELLQSHPANSSAPREDNAGITEGKRKKNNCGTLGASQEANAGYQKATETWCEANRAQNMASRARRKWNKKAFLPGTRLRDETSERSGGKVRSGPLSTP